jgi:hypothetical protein
VKVALRRPLMSTTLARVAAKGVVGADRKRSVHQVKTLAKSADIDASPDTDRANGDRNQSVEAPHLLERIAALERTVSALTATVETFRAARPRDAADTELRKALAISTDGRTFSAADLFQHAQIDMALAAALEAADISSPAELGAWLRSQRGTFEGVSVERLRRRCWRVHMCT